MDDRGQTDSDQAAETTDTEQTRIRHFRRQLAASVVAVCTVADEGIRAASVTACILASLQPPLILISIEQESQMEAWLREAGRFTVSLLPWRHQFLADRFAGLAPLASATFREVDHIRAPSGLPVISDSLAWADCAVIDELTTGDHVNFVGEVVNLANGTTQDDSPLIYFRNRYRRLQPVD